MRNWKKQLISLRWIILLQFIHFCSSVVSELFLFEVNKSMEFPLTTNTVFSRQLYTRGQNKINRRQSIALLADIPGLLWFRRWQNNRGGGGIFRPNAILGRQGCGCTVLHKQSCMSDGGLHVHKPELFDVNCHWFSKTDKVNINGCTEALNVRHEALDDHQYPCRLSSRSNKAMSKNPNK